MLRQLIFTIAAGTVILDVETIPGQDQELLSEIRTAWATRQDATTEFTASWIIDSGFGDSRTEKPVDPHPEPKTETIVLNGDALRYDWSERYYDIDGGPKGSMSWQTGTRTESYSQLDGWRSLLGNSLPNIRGSATINRMPRLAYTGLKNRGLFLFWFRGLMDELTQARFEDWKVAVDPRFKTAEPDEVVLFQGLPNGRIWTLTLSRRLNFLPLASRQGHWPADGQPFSHFSETTVKLSPESATDGLVRPVFWTDQEYRNGIPARRPILAVLKRFALKSDLSPTQMRVEFPSDLIPEDASKFVLPFKSTVAADRSAPDKHGPHWGFWGAIGFGGVLLVALVAKVRGQS